MSPFRRLLCACVPRFLCGGPPACVARAPQRARGRKRWTCESFGAVSSAAAQRASLGGAGPPRRGAAPSFGCVWFGSLGRTRVTTHFTRQGRHQPRPATPLPVKRPPLSPDGARRSPAPCCERVHCRLMPAHLCLLAAKLTARVAAAAKRTPRARLRRGKGALPRVEQLPRRADCGARRHQPRPAHWASLRPSALIPGRVSSANARDGIVAAAVADTCTFCRACHAGGCGAFWEPRGSQTARAPPLSLARFASARACVRLVSFGLLCLLAAPMTQGPILPPRQRLFWGAQPKPICWMTCGRGQSPPRGAQPSPAKRRPLAACHPPPLVKRACRGALPPRLFHGRCIDHSSQRRRGPGLPSRRHGVACPACPRRPRVWTAPLLDKALLVDAPLMDSPAFGQLRFWTALLSGLCLSRAPAPNDAKQHAPATPKKPTVKSALPPPVFTCVAL